MSYIENVTPATYAHYTRPEVMRTIQRIATDGVNTRCGNGNFEIWYKYKKNLPVTHFDLSKREDYLWLVGRYKTLYWSLNYFEPYLYGLNFDQYLPDHERIPKSNSSRISKISTVGYTFSVDIDAKKGDIREPAVKKAVEDMAQFYADEFRKFAPNGVYVLFSGGGAYVHLHHKVFDEYFKNPLGSYDEYVTALLNGFGEWLDDISTRFYQLHPQLNPSTGIYPEHPVKVGGDSLNGAKRIFKTIFSIHKSKPYVVVPLDPSDIKIDFDKATLPLKKDVLDAGDKWYRDYDTDGRILQEVRRYIEIAKIKKPKIEYDDDAKYERSETPIDIEKWPPCIKNMLALNECHEGKTRALAVLAAFMGQMGISEKDAYKLFTDIAKRWNASTTNIFESHFRIMRTPSCRTLTDSNNQGYPTGRSLKLLNVCKPDIRCINIISPRYYADKKANAERLKRKLIGDISPKEE